LERYFKYLFLSVAHLYEAAFGGRKTDDKRASFILSPSIESQPNRRHTAGAEYPVAGRRTCVVSWQPVTSP